MQSEEEKQADFNKRAAAFNEDLVELQNKHGLIIVPYLLVTPGGIAPQMQYIEKAEFDQRVNQVAGPVSSTLQS